MLTKGEFTPRGNVLGISKVKDKFPYHFAIGEWGNEEFMKGEDELSKSFFGNGFLYKELIDSVRRENDREFFMNFPREFIAEASIKKQKDYLLIEKLVILAAVTYYDLIYHGKIYAVPERAENNMFSAMAIDAYREIYGKQRKFDPEDIIEVLHEMEISLCYCFGKEKYKDRALKYLINEYVNKKWRMS